MAFRYIMMIIAHLVQYGTIVWEINDSQPI